MKPKRRTLIFAALGVAAGAATFGMLTSQPVIYVYKDAKCDCCNKWVSHLRDNGFTVYARDVSAPRDRARVGIAPKLDACHSALVAGYAIEGHVPAADIRRLLAERPVALGLAVPRMPRGSPGMEDPQPEAYQVLLVQRDGSTQVFASYAADGRPSADGNRTAPQHAAESSSRTA